MSLCKYHADQCVALLYHCTSVYHRKITRFDYVHTKHLSLLITAVNTMLLFKLLCAVHTNTTNLLIFHSRYFFFFLPREALKVSFDISTGLLRTGMRSPQTRHKSQVIILTLQPAQKHT